MLLFQLVIIFNACVYLSTSCAPQTIKNYKIPDDKNNTSNYDLTPLSDLLDIMIKSTDGIEMRSEPVISIEEPTKPEPVNTTEEPTTAEQPTITEQPMTKEQPTTALITSDQTTKLDDLTTKQAPPRVNLIRTTISSIDTKVEPILSCIYDEDTGLITNTSGDCYESCDNGKYLNVFFNENNILFCCCR